MLLPKGQWAIRRLFRLNKLTVTWSLLVIFGTYCERDLSLRNRYIYVHILKSSIAVNVFELFWNGWKVKCIYIEMKSKQVENLLICLFIIFF